MYDVQLGEQPSSDIITGSGSIYCRIKLKTPYLNTHFVQNSEPEHGYCSGVKGDELTELPHKAYTSNAVTCLINTRIYRSSVFSTVNSPTTVESEKFAKIQEFP